MMQGFGITLKQELDRTRKSILSGNLSQEQKDSLIERTNEIESSIADADLDKLLKLISELNDTINK